MSVRRGRTAMRRRGLSSPAERAFQDGLFDSASSVFDFGCGHGGDVRTLRQLGIAATGWDPVHYPGNPISPADVVNLGFVVNVIEDPSERREALLHAWKLARSVLVVSARLSWDRDSNIGVPFGDGRLTDAGTFQKFFEPSEFKAWVESTIGRTAITAAPGVLYVFRDERGEQALLARRSRDVGRQPRAVAELLYKSSRETLDPLERFVADQRRLPTAAEVQNAADVIEMFGSLRAGFAIIRQATDAALWQDVELAARKRSERRFEEHLAELQPLIDFVTDRGRLPRAGELSNDDNVVEEFGSTRAAFSLVRRATGAERWEAALSEARSNFLVYCALAAFGGRPRFSSLPDDLQYDAKDLFGSYRKACEEADRLLFSIADLDAVGEACIGLPFGKLMPEALYVHVDYVQRLPMLLRVYEGAARQITGDIDDATLVKINRAKPQVSFLVYPDFEREPHPVLEASIVSKLGQIRLKHRYFGDSSNPPILHRKDLFVPEDHPTFKKFAELSRQEETAGLLNRPDIGTKEGWDRALAEAGYTLRGHQLRQRRDR